MHRLKFLIQAGLVMMASAASLLAIPVAKAEAPARTPAVLVLLNLSNTLDLTARLGQEGVRIALESSPNSERHLADFKFFDIDENVALAAKQLQAEILRSRPVAIIGIIRSDLAFSIAEIAEKNQIPFITPMATHPQLTHGRKFVFRTCFDDDRQAELLARFIYGRRHLKRGAILYNRSFSYSAGFKTAFVRAYTALGGKIVAARPFTNESEIDRALIGELESLGPEFVILPSYQLEAAAMLAKLSRTLPPAIEYFGPDSWGGGAYFKPIFSGASERVTAFYSDHWAKEDPRPANREFLNNYRAHPPVAAELKGQETPTLSNIVSHYEVARFIIQALKGWKSGEPLVSSIRRTIFHGPRGTVAFRSSNSPANPIRIFKIEPLRERFVTTFGDNQ